MKKLKKLTAISLVFIMMLGLCVTSYSAVDTESSSKNTNAALAEELPAKRSVQAVQAVQPTENTSSTELSSIPAVEEEEPTKAEPKYLTLSQAVLSLGIGERYTLCCTLPDGSIASNISYSSNNSLVARVDFKTGEVIAAGTGTAQITAKTPGGTKAVCNITVGYAPSSIVINKTKLVLGIGEQFNLNSYLPSGCASYNTAYSTNNALVADVVKDNGLVTAKAVGTAKITVKTYNGKTAVCTFTVKPQAKSVTLNSKEIVMYVGEAFDLNSSIPKNTAAYYRLYSTSNAKTATVTRGGGIVKALKVGTATISCTLSNGKKAICKVYIMSSSKKIANVPLIGQQKLPTGCETCSAVMLLNYYGYNISETSFADKYLIKRPLGYGKYGLEGPDPNCAFIGSPYTTNSFGAYAPVMAKSMNSYLAKKSYKAVSVSGKSLEYLAGKYIAQGQPVMVWATIYMTASYKTTTWRVNYTDENARYKKGSSYTWLANEHCLLLTGYDSNFYYFNDPWTNSRIAYSKSVVNTRYNELGKQAVVMVKK